MLNGLDLFSGYGGITLGLSRWVRPVAYCEIEPYAQAILLSRMAEGTLPRGPIWDDVRTLDGKPFRGKIDILYGGFPCQDISLAKADAEGLAGERSGLVKEVYRLAEEIQPTFIFLENVAGIRTRGLETVVRELSALGYDCRWTMLAASDCGAPHERKRWFLLAYAHSARLEIGSGESGDPQAELKAALGGMEGTPAGFPRRWKKTAPAGVLRMAHRDPHRVDRIKAIGGGVVPFQVETAFRKLMGLKDDE